MSTPETPPVPEPKPSAASIVAPAPVAPVVSPAPADWKGGEAAWHDLHSARTARKAAEQALEAERAARVKLEAELTTKASAAEQRAAETAAKYERDTALLGTPGVPETFRHPRMRDRLWQDYQGHKAAAGDKAQPFAAWVLSEEVKTDPLYSAHFAAPAPDPHQAPDLPTPPAPPAGSATGTVLPPAGRPVQYTESMIDRLRSEGKWKAGRVDTTTGQPVGGSPHWQAWIRGGAKTYKG